MRWLKIVSKLAFAMLFIGGGINHFVDPEFYLRMMPAYLPAHELLVAVSGVCEVVLGVALLIPRFSHLAAWGLIALLIAVFPANLQMALHTEQYPDVPELGLWVRLPLQGVLIWWAWLYTRPRS